MPTNEIKPVAASSGANVATQAAFAANTAILNNGFASGVVDSATFNKILRQASFVAAALAQTVVDKTGVDVLDDGNLAALITNLKNALLVGVTPPQFDNDTSVATTAFVKSAGKRYSTRFPFNASATLTLSHVGGLAYLFGASNATFTIPAASTIPEGETITIQNQGTATLTLARTGADVFQTNGNSATSLTIQSGEFVELVSLGAGNSWFAHGTGTLSFSGSFAASLGTSGYRKLPSGDIEQWGSVTTSASADTPVTFPIAFPNAIYHVVIGTLMSGANMAGYNSPTVTGMNINCFSSGGARSVANVSYRVIGR